MPQERENQYPFPTAEDVANAPGSREEKAARNIIVRHISGIPRRGYLLGECDHAPIYKGVTDLTTLCYALVDAIDAAAPLHGSSTLPVEIIEANAALAEVLEYHGCPPAAEQEIISDASETG